MLAYWDGGGITTVAGLIRPEDLEDRQGCGRGRRRPARCDAPPRGRGGAGIDATEEDAHAISSCRLPEGDLRTERAAVIGAALAADPALAHDLLLFKVAADLLARFGRRLLRARRHGAARAERPHGKPDGVDRRPAEALARLASRARPAWWERRQRSVPERFEAFRRSTRT